MAVEDTRRAMEAYVGDLLQRGPYKRHFSDDVVVSLVGTDQGAQGPDDAEAWIDYLHTQAFKARPELKSMIVADGQAAAEFDFVGEHVGEFGGIAATGREVRVPYSMVYDLQGEEIGAVRIYLSMEICCIKSMGLPNQGCRSGGVKAAALSTLPSLVLEVSRCR